MDFVSVVLFLAIYYLRPQEWTGFLSRLRPVQLVMILALTSLLVRDRKLTLKDFFQTPHDWIMTAYFLWTIFASPTPWSTFTSIQSQILTYYVTVQALTNLTRMHRFLGWWALMMMIIAALAVVSQYGFDPLDSYTKTIGQMKGRLILNFSIFNNPNALAHSIIPVIPMLFFLLFWKRVFMKASIPLLLLPLWCIYLTMSKGAFLCGFATILATVCFGRPKIVQAMILILAASVGYGALYTLPRMNELKKSSTDEAIQGRIEAYRHGLKCMQSYNWGIGLSNFGNHFLRFGPLERPEFAKRIKYTQNGKTRVRVMRRHYAKAPHGAYNQNGAELGYIGLFLFVGIIYCCMRTHMTALCSDAEEERIRRCLFAIVLSYAVSSWMVDFCYRTTFFLFVAATGAFHRHLIGYLDFKNIQTEKEQAPDPLILGSPKQTMPTLAPAVAQQAVPCDEPVQLDLRPVSVPVAAHGTIHWQRIGLFDLAMMLFLTWCTVLYWKHLIQTM